MMIIWTGIRCIILQMTTFRSVRFCAFAPFRIRNYIINHYFLLQGEVCWEPEDGGGHRGSRGGQHVGEEESRLHRLQEIPLRLSRGSWHQCVRLYWSVVLLENMQIIAACRAWYHDQCQMLCSTSFPERLNAQEALRWSLCKSLPGSRKGRTRCRVSTTSSPMASSLSRLSSSTTTSSSTEHSSF